MKKPKLMNKIHKKKNVRTDRISAQGNKSQHDHGYTVTTARSVKEVEEIRDIWKKIQIGPAADIDYYLTVVNSRKQVVRPHVIILSHDKYIESMLVGRIEDMRLEFKFGYKTLFRPKVRSLTIVEGGILGNTSYTNCAALISEVVTSLKQREADIVSFSEIPIDSNIYKIAKKMLGFLCRDHFPTVHPHYKMTLPATIDDFLRVRKNRKRLRNEMRRLQKSCSGNVAIKIFRERGQIDEFWRDAYKISKKTYQYALGGSFVNNIETPHLLTFLADRGWLRAYILYLEEKPLAFDLGYLHKNTYYDKNTGYDPKYKKFGVGTILLLKIIEDLCSDCHIHYIDFGAGDSAEKRRFCDLKCEEASFYIFKPKMKGVKLNAMRTISGASQRLGKKFLTRTILKEKWEKFKRQRAESKPNHKQ